MLILIRKTPQNRSNRLEVICRKGVLRNSTKFKGKYLSLWPATSLKKRLWHRCFPVNYAKFLRTHPVAASDEINMLRKSSPSQPLLFLRTATYDHFIAIIIISSI